MVSFGRLALGYLLYPASLYVVGYSARFIWLCCFSRRCYRCPGCWYKVQILVRFRYIISLACLLEQVLVAIRGLFLSELR